MHLALVTGEALFSKQERYAQLLRWELFIQYLHLYIVLRIHSIIHQDTHLFGSICEAWKFYPTCESLANQSNFSAAFQLVTRWLSFHLKFIVVYFICKSMVCNHVSPWNCKLCIPLFKLVHADLGQGRKGSHLQIMKGLQWFSIVLRRNLYANAAEGSNSFHISLLHCPPFSKFGIFPIRSWS